MKYIVILLTLSVALFANKAFIEPQELYNKLGDKNIVIIDTADIKSYEKEHIAGARRADISAFRHWVDNQYMLMNSSQEIQKAARSLGINNDSYVVLYGQNGNKRTFKASYIALALIVNGFDNISILNGGFAAFKQELGDKKDPFCNKATKILLWQFSRSTQPKNFSRYAICKRACWKYSNDRSKT